MHPLPHPHSRCYVDCNVEVNMSVILNRNRLLDSVIDFHSSPVEMMLSHSE